MIVVAVIAILCSMLLPALNHAKDAAKRIKCAGNLKQLGMAAEMYCGDYDGWCLTSGYKYNGKSLYWNSMLVRELQYLKNNWAAATCPLNTNEIDGDWDSGYGLNGSTFGYGIYASSPPINTNRLSWRIGTVRPYACKISAKWWTTWRTSEWPDGWRASPQ